MPFRGGPLRRLVQPAVRRVSPPETRPPIALTWTPENMVPEPSAVWVERSRHGLSRPSRYSYPGVAPLRIPPLPSSPALGSRVRRHPTTRARPDPLLVGTSGYHGRPLRRCRHLRSDISRYDIGASVEVRHDSTASPVAPSDEVQTLRHQQPPDRLASMKMRGTR